jgi:hypothetical protein
VIIVWGRASSYLGVEPLVGSWSTFSIPTNRSIFPSGVASAFAAGTAFLSAPIGPTGIPAGDHEGTPTIVPQAAVILPTGLPSGAAIGGPNIAQGTQFIVPAGLASAFAAGTPAMHINFVIAQVTLVDGFPSGGLDYGQIGAPPAIAGGDSNLSLWINGTRRDEFLLRGTCQVQRLVNKSASASFTLEVDGSGGYLPAPGDRVVINDGGKTFFAGIIDEVDAVLLDSTAYSFTYSISCIDWMALCDRRLVFQVFAAGLKPVSVVQLTTDNFLSLEGIDWHFTPRPPGTLPELTYSGATVAEVFNDLTRLTGYQWTIDFQRRLLFTPPTSGTVFAGYSIATDNGKYRPGLMVKRSVGNYRNVQYVRSDELLIGSRHDTITSLAGQVDFLTQFPVSTKPIVKVDGVAVVVKQLHVDADALSGWYWTLNFTNVTNQAIPPGAGHTIDIYYTTFISNVVESLNNTQIAARRAATGLSGRIEQLEEFKNVALADAEAIADGLLRKYGAGLPVDVTFENDEFPPDPSMLLNVDLPAFGISSAQYLVSGVRSTSLAGTDLGKGTSFRSQVSLTSGEEQQADYTQWFGELVRRTKQGEPIIKYQTATWAMAVGTDATLVTGDNGANPHIVRQAGQLAMIKAIAAHAPAGDVFRCDILRSAGGVGTPTSIFVAGKYVEIPVGSTKLVTLDLVDTTGLVPIQFAADDVLTINVLLAHGSAITVTVQWAVLEKGPLG